MELSDLHVFKTVVETGGITKAANKLHRVPSNVTFRIQKLEQELAQTLFIREKKRLRISPAGEQLLDYAERILSLASEAKEQFRNIKPKGLLRIGSIEMAAATRLIEPLMRFHREYPEVELRVKSNPTGVLIEKVLAGDLDIALVSEPEKDPRLSIEQVFKEDLVIVSDPKHGKIKSPSDLGLEPTLLGFSTKCMYRKRMSEWLKESSIIANVVEVNSYHAMLSCVTAGMGVGIIPQAVVDIYPFSDGLRIHPLPVKWRKSSTSLIWRKDSIKPSMTAFTETMMSFK
jgi:DNA-binding transcriptional LysR family regulator